MHPDELPVDDVLVRSLLAEQFPEWAGLPLRRVASAGTVNALYRLGDELLVRLPLRADWGDGVLHEHEWLPRLAPLLPVATPVLRGRGAPSADYPSIWSVYAWLDGANPIPGSLETPEELAVDLAAFVGALRQVDPAGAPESYRGGSLAPRDEEFKGFLAEARDEVDPDAASAAWEAALSASEWAGGPVWTHADLLPGNLLVSSGRLSAVLDWAASGVGDPACDLIPAWYLLPSSVRPSFRDALEVDDATWERARGWALSIGVIALPYYRDTNLVMAEHARHVIREVLADLR
jgi:aminoglycoside phosphotransferase (APT) family kinase protein